MIDAISAFLKQVYEIASLILKQVYEIASIIIKSIYDFGMAIANDPVVIYITRTLIAEPIIATAKFIGTVYLGAYAFITNNAIKYYLFIDSESNEKSLFLKINFKSFKDGCFSLNW
jgi:hypothetical protein